MNPDHRITAIPDIFGSEKTGGMRSGWPGCTGPGS